MCSSGGQIAANDEALQAAQTASTKQLTQDYGTTFAEQQSVLAQQTARLNAIAANPMGYTPAQLHSATTSINENTANAAKSAIGAASAYAAAHGASDIGSGVTGQIAGQVATGAALSKAQQLSLLGQQNEDWKQQNFWNAIQGLNSTGAEYGGAGGTAIGGANSAAEGAVNAGEGALKAKQAGWQNVMGVISGIGGLASAASGFSGGGGGNLINAPAGQIQDLSGLPLTGEG